jgi:transposase
LLSWKVRGSLRKKGKEVKESLKGYFKDFHRMILAAYYRHYQFLSEQVQAFEAEMARRMEPYAQQVTALMTIPGVQQIVAWHLIAEMGTDMSVFPDADHCASWGGLSPGSCERFFYRVKARRGWGKAVLAGE